MMMTTITAEQVIAALRTLRAPIQQGEYDLHRLVMDALESSGIPAAHEVKLAPRCRIDLMAGSVGIECKRGPVDRARVLRQLERYAACEEVTAIVLVSEKTVRLPREMYGKRVYGVCLNRLWGIAL